MRYSENRVIAQSVVLVINNYCVSIARMNPLMSFQLKAHFTDLNRFILGEIATCAGEFVLFLCWTAINTGRDSWIKIFGQFTIPVSFYSKQECLIVFILHFLRVKDSTDFFASLWSLFG